MVTQLKLEQKSKKNEFAKIAAEAKIILKEFDLCDNCTGRLFSKKLGVSSNKNLGKKIKNYLKFKSKTKCYICKDIFTKIQQHVKLLEDNSSDYSFSTFLIGGKLKPSLNDRDDQIRSKFKIKGADSLKADLIHQIGKKFSQKTKTKYDHLRPDITFTLDFKTDSCETLIRPLLVYGRYSKNKRGLLQRQGRCNQCRGRGCYSCEFHGLSGYDSVEGKIAKFLIQKFLCTTIKFNWIGGEDKNSLVLGKGRPFFAKIFDPKFRRKALGNKYYRDGIVIHNPRIIPQVPKKQILFSSSVNLLIKTSSTISTKVLKELKSLENEGIRISRNNKKSTKKHLDKVKFERKSPNSFLLKMIVEGGFPVKNFVEGKNVHPNITEILKTDCKCVQFDFNEIKLN